MRTLFEFTPPATEREPATVSTPVTLVIADSDSTADEPNLESDQHILHGEFITEDPDGVLLTSSTGDRTSSDTAPAKDTKKDNPGYVDYLQGIIPVEVIVFWGSVIGLLSVVTTEPTPAAGKIAWGLFVIAALGTIPYVYNDIEKKALTDKKAAREAYKKAWRQGVLAAFAFILWALYLDAMAQVSLLNVGIGKLEISALVLCYTFLLPTLPILGRMYADGRALYEKDIGSTTEKTAADAEGIL